MQSDTGHMQLAPGHMQLALEHMQSAPGQARSDTGQIQFAPGHLQSAPGQARYGPEHRRSAPGHPRSGQPWPRATSSPARSPTSESWHSPARWRHRSSNPGAARLLLAFAVGGTIVRYRTAGAGYSPTPERRPGTLRLQPLNGPRPPLTVTPSLGLLPLLSPQRCRQQRTPSAERRCSGSNPPRSTQVRRIRAPFLQRLPYA